MLVLLDCFRSTYARRAFISMVPGLGQWWCGLTDDSPPDWPPERRRRAVYCEPQRLNRRATGRCCCEGCQAPPQGCGVIYSEYVQDCEIVSANGGSPSPTGGRLTAATASSLTSLSLIWTVRLVTN